MLAVKVNVLPFLLEPNRVHGDGHNKIGRDTLGSLVPALATYISE